jgi:hypothetical protein
MDKALPRKRYKLAELLAEMPEYDFSQPRSDENSEWLEMPDVGLEVIEQGWVGKMDEAQAQKAKF